jgi:hypothetical protein
MQAYVLAKVKQFAGAFTRRFNMTLSQQQLEMVVAESLATVPQEQNQISSRVLRLVLRHDCQ